MAKNTSTANGNGDQELFLKKASFIQHSLPGLKAGVYDLSVQQQFTDSDGKSITIDELASVDRRFGVQGPKYSLKQDAIHSVYPPPSTSGAYSNDLAHVVLERKKLPWLRSPYLPGLEPASFEMHYTASYGGNSYPKTCDSDQASWLAVLLLSPSDLGGHDPAKAVKQGKAADLVPKPLKMTNSAKKTTVAGTMPKNYYSIFSYALEPAYIAKNGGTAPKVVDPGVGHLPDEDCRYIDIPAAVFNKLAPSPEDLQMMAHVRAVQMDAKPISDGQAVQPEEEYSLVIGNRLPESLPTPSVPPVAQTATARGKNVALLVSLENMQESLRGHDANSYYAKNIAANGFVRLVVFHQWSFTSEQDTTFEFEHILKTLNGREAHNDNAIKVKNPLLRLPNPPPSSGGPYNQQVVADMLGLGYTPMNQVTRVPYKPTAGTTEQIQTVSWYRGPLVPFAKKATIEFISGDDAVDQQAIIFSPDELLQFDPKVGMYDASYAAAWQLGQLVSLRDKSFSVSLYRWKKTVAHQFLMLLENQALQDDHAELMQLYNAILAAEKRKDVDKALYKGVIHMLANS